MECVGQHIIGYRGRASALLWRHYFRLYHIVLLVHAGALHLRCQWSLYAVAEEIFKRSVTAPGTWEYASQLE